MAHGKKKKSWWDKLNMGKNIGSSSKGAKGFGAVLAGKKGKSKELEKEAAKKKLKKKGY